MKASVHAGTLLRRFEELCRIRIRFLDELIKARREAFALDGTSLQPPKRGGVYAFWWTGALPRLANDRRKRHVFHGPGGRDVPIELDDEWLGIDAKLPIPLYVGKTADSLRRRLGMHLLLGSPEPVLLPSRHKAKAPTTSCQLRAGIERLFPNEKRPIELVRHNVGMSFVDLHGDTHAANRFYLENMAIGLMRPILNVDVER